MKKGFTLMELLIVIAIIGILISVSVASYSSAQKKGRDARRLADMKAVQNAFEQYYADHDGSYPATCAIDTTYLPGGFPTDPKNNITETDPTKKYVYEFTDAHCSAVSYCFCAHLESGTGNANADPGSATCTYSSGSYNCVGSLQ